MPNKNKDNERISEAYQQSKRQRFFKSDKELIDAIFAAQTKWVTKNIGKKEAEQMNFGWGIGGDETFTSVASKIYGLKGGTLQTNADLYTNPAEFEMEFIGHNER